MGFADAVWRKLDVKVTEIGGRWYQLVSRTARPEGHRAKVDDNDHQQDPLNAVTLWRTFKYFSKP